jgi:SAM-dependent methyltransferase
MSKRTLTPRAYDLLQRFVHGTDDPHLHTVRAAYAPFAGSPVLELGCGTGRLSVAFEPGVYTGVDIDGARITTARAEHPGAAFVHADARFLEPAFFAPFRFLFCHAWLHHVDDATCRGIFAAIARASTDTPRVLMVWEPALARPLRNPVGWALGKLDRGDFVRPPEAMRTLCEPFVEDVVVVPGPWRWPIPGIALRLVFDSDRAARFLSAHP